MVLMFLIFFIAFLSYVLFRSDNRSIHIVVLGDIGRSPRMQYHALCFAEQGYRVHLIGYKGTSLMKELLDQSLVIVHHIPVFRLSCCGELLNSLLKLLTSGLYILFLCGFILPRCEKILVQNPPSMPTLLCVQIIRIFRRTRLIIDWHNLAFSLVELKYRNRYLTLLSKRYEQIFGNFADLHLCVTRAMKEFLISEWKIRGMAVVLYDQPHERYHSFELHEIHKFMCLWEQDNLRLKTLKNTILSSEKDGDGEVTLITSLSIANQVSYHPQRPLFLISSTSWTVDEDFSVLLRALEDLEDKMKLSSRKLPKVLCVITGKGPMKKYYEDEIEKKRWEYCHFITTWLSSEDYPKVLACADLGISLHKSSSGLDLPMKLLDMYGAGLPVCAAKYACLSELVEEDVTGWMFANHSELSDRLMLIVEDFPESIRLSSMKQTINSRYLSWRWKDCWRQTMIPLLTKHGEGSHLKAY